MGRPSGGFEVSDARSDLGNGRVTLDQSEILHGDAHPFRPPVLIADDDPFVRTYLTKALTRLGYPVTQVEDGNAVLAHLASNESTRILILDWVMPPPDGVELCERVRRDFAHRNLYLMAVTGRAPKHLDRLLEAGADDILSKPIDARELETRLVRARHCVGGSSQRSLADAMREAADSEGGGEVVVRTADAIARIHVSSQGRVEWAHVKPPRQRLTALLREHGLQRDEIRAVVEECRQSGQRFDRVVIDWELLERDVLIGALRTHFREELSRFQSQAGATVAFLPGRTEESGLTSFTFEEVAPWVTEAPMLIPSEHPPRPEEPRAQAIADRLITGYVAVGNADAVFLFDPKDGQCLVGEGEQNTVDLAWTAARGLSRIRLDGDETDELIVTSNRRYCVSYFIVETLASGVVLFDADLDGNLDIYFPNGRPLPPTNEGDAAYRGALYRNDGGLRFTDVTDAAGVPGTAFGVGGAAADIDGDGDLDLYICQYGENVLYRNVSEAGSIRFEEVPGVGGATDARFSAGASFFDYDRDGDLDLYVTNYCQQSFETSKPCLNQGVAGYCAPGQYPAAGDSLFKNLGDGIFENATAAAGLEKPASKRGRGMGVVATDVDDDGWLDVYVANDGSENFLFRNRGDGTFVDVALEAGVALSVNGDEQGSMGVAVADFDRDGHVDIFCTNYQKQLNALYRGDAEQFYADVGMGQGLGESCLPMVSWGTKFFDYDHDGWLDLFIANGHLEDNIHRYDQSSTYLQRNQLFRGTGAGRFAEVTGTAGPGLAVEASSRGAAFGDIDGDGDIDIVVCNSRGKPSLLVNEGGPRGHWVMLDLRDRRGRHAIGASVRLTAGRLKLSGEVRAGSSYLSQNDLRLHFGLGGAQQADTVEVRWPDGTREVFDRLAAGAVHELKQGSGRTP